MYRMAIPLRDYYDRKLLVLYLRARSSPFLFRLTRELMDRRYVRRHAATCYVSFQTRPLSWISTVTEKAEVLSPPHIHIQVPATTPFYCSAAAQHKQTHFHHRHDDTRPHNPIYTIILLMIN